MLSELFCKVKLSKKREGGVTLPRFLGNLLFCKVFICHFVKYCYNIL